MNPITYSPILKSKMGSMPRPSKLSKVSFEIPSEDSDLVQYLKHLSLESSCGKLNNFMKELLSPNTEDAVLINWMKQLKDNIFILDKENERIVGALLDIKWTVRGNEVVTVYQELVLNLVSAHTYYLRSVLLMIIKVFSTVEDGGTADSEAYKKAHFLLQHIVQLVPLSSQMLCRLISEKFPYVKRPSNMILAYSVNVLNMCSYLPAYRLIILEHLIGKFLQIDAFCPRHTIEQWELDKEDDDQALNMEMDSLPADNMAYPIANTLDVLMQSLFHFIDCTCYIDGSKELNWDVTKKLYRELLTVFDKLILTTLRSCHVQFILFYICSLRPPLYEGFIDYLWKKVKNPSTAPIQRQVSAFYIGSLLARSTYISISTVTECFDLMCNWVHSYISNHDSLSSLDVGTHGTFYCVCQTLFYVFAFRHKEFINMKNGFKYLRNLNFERMVTCRLNPLKFCLHTIVQNFASVARNYQIAYCYPVIERNNRSLMLSTDSLTDLSTFFPFDPYTLKQSKKWIEPLYRVYDAHNDDDSMEQDAEESMLDESGIHNASDYLFSYSSSPGFKKSNFIALER